MISPAQTPHGRVRATATGRRLALVWIQVALLSVGATARAEPSQVVLEPPSVASPVVEEARVRLAAELGSAGFVVVPSSATPMARFRLTPLETGAIEVRLDEYLSGKSLLQVIDASAEEPSRAASRVAISAIELLRASLLELAVEDERTRSPLPPEATAIVGEVRPRPAERGPSSVDVEAPSARKVRFLLGAGGAAIAGFAEWGVAAAPMVALGLMRERLLVQLTVAAPTTSFSADGEGGRARIVQAFGLLDVGVAPLHVAPWFELHVGAGLHRVAARGEALSPELVGSRSRAWSVLVDVGVGVRWPLTAVVSLTSSLHLALTRPFTAVRLGDEVVARTKLPLPWLAIGVSLAL